MGKKKTLNDFLNQAKEKYPYLDFSLVNKYVNNNTSIEVICHEKDYAGIEHGIFRITPANLLSGKSCPKCKGKNFTSEDRKLFCSIKYSGKYDYSKSDFSSVKKKTIVTCPIHGDFETDYDHHFNSNVGCKWCSCPVRDTLSFKKEASKIHKGFYIYDKVEYKDSHSNVTIICPTHGEFEQSPNAHLNGQGCPKCAHGKIVLEDKTSLLLEEKLIPFIHNKRPKWLISDKKGQLSLDFYLPEINLAIECQGKQHFGFGGWSKKFDFKKQFELDKWKKEQCNENKVNLVYFANKYEAPKKYIGTIFTNENELMDYIEYLYKNKE